jgi:hypothetical protein
MPRPPRRPHPPPPSLRLSQLPPTRARLSAASAAKLRSSTLCRSLGFASSAAVWTATTPSAGQSRKAAPSPVAAGALRTAGTLRTSESGGVSLPVRHTHCKRLTYLTVRGGKRLRYSITVLCGDENISFHNLAEGYPTQRLVTTCCYSTLCGDHPGYGGNVCITCVLVLLKVQRPPLIRHSPLCLSVPPSLPPIYP